MLKGARSVVCTEQFPRTRTGSLKFCGQLNRGNIEFEESPFVRKLIMKSKVGEDFLQVEVH